VVRTTAPVAGGCISPSFRALLDDGRTVFLKTAPAGAAPDLMAAEAISLRALAEAGAVRTPEVLGEGARWLALEWLEPAVATAGAWAELGSGLARLHRCRAGRYGWPRDNFIGPLPQANDAASSWSGFWAERRLLPQLERARASFDVPVLRRFDELLARLPALIGAAEEEGASLLHGDLWNGNVHMTADGPALIDPSSYHGHREVDLAMAELFGGFPAGFHHAYAAEWPLLPGAARRRSVYQLYYLLVHVNLFGGGYVSGTERALSDALA
jgi:fructosamine-3-kinase